MRGGVASTLAARPARTSASIGIKVCFMVVVFQCRG
jgi:hypothetical protein